MFPHFKVITADMPVVVVVIVTAVCYPVIENRTATTLTLITFSVHMYPFKELVRERIVHLVPASKPL